MKIISRFFKMNLMNSKDILSWLTLLYKELHLKSFYRKGNHEHKNISKVANQNLSHGFIFKYFLLMFIICL